MSKFIFVLFLLAGASCNIQAQHYTTANAHSHNDYEQAIPLYDAWENQFGSIEADVFLFDGKLVVAHDSSQMLRRWTLDSLYLNPLQALIERNAGYVYPDSNRSLQLMIDIKSEAIATLDKLIETIGHFNGLTTTSSLKIVISGNRPPPSQFSSYPSWILFDGELQKKYQQQELQKVVMLSDNFARYSQWQGSGEMSAEDKHALKRLIDKAHDAGKKIRFWNAPDTPQSWKTFSELGTDYINTDRIGELSKFLKLLNRV